jgi:MtfA peptidase
LSSVNLVFLLIVLAGIGLFVYTTFLRDKWIRRRPFPAEWDAQLEARLAPYSTLSADEKSRLQQLIQLFLAKKRFYGCNGLEINDEIRLSIAAQACLLVLNQGWAVYPKLMSILVYPDAFRAERETQLENGTIAAANHHMLGESWSNGKVILSWDDVTRGARDFTDGHNVVLHEFAHQLDGQSGSTNGAPPLYRNSYQSWARVFGENYTDLQERIYKRLPRVMDDYGATNPAEFFAVATEAFFEKPGQLKEHRPDIYEELSKYYNLDPERWHQQA